MTNLGLPLVLGLLECFIIASICLALEQPQHNLAKRVLGPDTEGIRSSFFGGNKVYKCYGMSGSQPRSGNSFQESKALCNIEGGILASFASRDELDFIKNLECDLTIQGNFWIGLKRDSGKKQFKWISGEPFTSLSEWAPKAPDLESNNLCALTKTLQGPWYDVPCSLRAGRICMFIESFAPSHAPITSLPTTAPSWRPSLSPTPPTTNVPSNSPIVTVSPTGSPTELRGVKTFYAYRVSMSSFSRARSFCELKGMQLASITSDEDLYQISRALPYPEQGWIGYESPYWTDGSSLTYIRSLISWFSHVVSGRCLIFIGGGGFKDMHCSGYYFAEYTICHEYNRYAPPLQLDLPKYFHVFNTGSLNWFEAKSYCLDRRMTMATIMNSEDHERVLSVICPQNSNCGRQVWIGLRRNQSKLGEFRWVDGSPMTFSAWAPSQPDNNYEDCVHHYTSGKWNDKACSGRFNEVLCQTNIPPTTAPTTMFPSRSPSLSPTYAPTKMLPGRTKGYWVIPGGFNWMQAKQTCENRGMGLATILNLAELEAAKRALTSSERTTISTCWIGLRSESIDQYEWVTGEALDFAHWSDRQPWTQDLKRAGCVAASRELSWTDKFCHEPNDILCEYDASMPLSANPQDPSNDNTTSEACTSVGRITTSLRGNKLGDSNRIINDGIPILYDLCTNYALPWFQQAVAFRYELTALKPGNYTFNPVLQLVEHDCQDVWISMAVSSYSCDTFPERSSVIACSSWALRSSLGTPALSILINERKILNFHLEFRATTNDSLNDCLKMSRMSLDLEMISDEGNRLTTWIAVTATTLLLLGMLWYCADQVVMAIFVGLLMVAEMFALIGYLAFAGVTQSVETVMIYLFFAPGIFTFSLMKLFRVRQTNPSSTNTCCSSWVWWAVQEFILPLNAVLTCGFFPRGIVSVNDSFAPFESSDTRLALLLVAYVSRFVFLTIPTLVCVIFNAVDVGVTEEWPFIVVMVISTLLTCVYLVAIVVRTCFRWTQDEILHTFVLFGTSFMSNSTTRNHDPESTPSPHDQSRTNNYTSSVPTQATPLPSISRNSNAQPVQPIDTGSGARRFAGTVDDVDDLYEPEWGDSRRFAVFKHDQNYDGFFPKENEEKEAPHDAAAPSLDCGICLSSGSDMMALNCGHIVCQDCLAGLRREHRPCPFCRKPIQSTIKLYL